jgi:hypothetical protein
VFQAGNRGVARLKQLVGLHSELGNLARTRQLRAAAPVAISSQSIHIGQNPASHHKIRLLARLALKIQAHRYIGRFKTDQ